MSIILGSATVPSSSTVVVFTVPILSNFTLFQPSGQQAVYLGTSPKVSSTNGLMLSASPTSMDGYNSTGASTYYATTGTTVASSFQYIIATSN